MQKERSGTKKFLRNTMTAGLAVSALLISPQRVYGGQLQGVVVVTAKEGSLDELKMERKVRDLRKSASELEKEMKGNEAIAQRKEIVGLLAAMVVKSEDPNYGFNSPKKVYQEMVIRACEDVRQTANKFKDKKTAKTYTKLKKKYVKSYGLPKTDINLRSGNDDY